MTSLSFVVPAYNESQRIEGTLKEILKTINDVKIKDTEIIVVDDNSVDQTLSIVANFKKKNSRTKIIYHKNGINLGFGGSVKEGIKLSSKKSVIYIPGDNSHAHTEIKKIVSEIGNFDIVSTYYTNKENRTFFRRSFTGFYTPILNYLFGLDLPYYNGVSLINKRIFKNIKITTNSHSWQVELWVKSKYIKKFSYKFVPTVLRDRINGATAFKLKNSLKVFFNIIRLTFINLYFYIQLKFFNNLK